MNTTELIPESIGNLVLIGDITNKLIIPIDEENGYEIDEAILRLYATPLGTVHSLGDGTPGSHNRFIKALILDYINLYHERENF